MSSAASAVPEEAPLPHIELHSIDANRPEDFNAALGIWHILRGTSVDAATAPNPSFLDFQDQERCLLFQAIHADLGEKGKKESALFPAINSVQDVPMVEEAPVLPLNIRKRLSLFRDDDEMVMNAVNAASTSAATQSLEEVFSAHDHDMEDPPFGYLDDSAASPSSMVLDPTPDRYPQQPPPPPPPVPLSEPASVQCDPPIVGLIYILSSELNREALIGLALAPYARGKRIGAAALHQALTLAFDVFAFHRVALGLVDAPATRAAALRMFIAAGFTLEGKCRRAMLIPRDGPGESGGEEWRDAHFLGMLDTDWFSHGAGLARPGVRCRTRWDEMLARHEREQELLAADEERSRILKRTASTETLRPSGSGAREIIADSGLESGAETEAESEASHRSGRSRGASATPVDNSNRSEGGIDAQDPFGDEAAAQSTSIRAFPGHGISRELLREMERRIARSSASSSSASVAGAASARSTSFLNIHASASSSASSSEYTPFIEGRPSTDAVHVGSLPPDSSSEYESAASSEDQADSDMVEHWAVPLESSEDESGGFVDADAVEAGRRSALWVGPWRSRVAAESAMEPVEAPPSPLRTLFLMTAQASAINEHGDDNGLTARTPSVAIEPPFEPMIPEISTTEPPPAASSSSLPVSTVSSSMGRPPIRSRNLDSDSDSDSDGQIFRSSVGLLSGATAPDHAPASATGTGSPSSVVETEVVLAGRHASEPDSEWDVLSESGASSVSTSTTSGSMSLQSASDGEL